MTDNRKSGLALIAGSVGGIVTMAIHPTSAGVLTPAQFERLATVSAIAHSLAIVSFVVMLLGVIGLSMRLGASDRLAFSGMVVFAVGAVAILIAASVSGFIIPNIMKEMIKDAPTDAPQWRIVVAAIFQINQAFASIYAVAASIAIGLWSISALRNGGLLRGIAIYGCVIAPIIVIAICSGHLRLNVHGMAVVVFSHAIWLIVAGTQLWNDTRDTLPAS